MTRPPNTVHRCPVCRRSVQKTPAGKIMGHYDRAHTYCPGSFAVWEITIAEQETPR